MKATRHVFMTVILRKSKPNTVSTCFFTNKCCVYELKMYHWHFFIRDRYFGSGKKRGCNIWTLDVFPEPDWPSSLIGYDAFESLGRGSECLHVAFRFHFACRALTRVALGPFVCANIKMCKDLRDCAVLRWFCGRTCVSLSNNRYVGKQKTKQNSCFCFSTD